MGDALTRCKQRSAFLWRRENLFVMCRVLPVVPRRPASAGRYLFQTPRFMNEGSASSTGKPASPKPRACVETKDLRLR